ncbi:hypothetical protein EON80_14775, partial [bacterium]
MEEFTQSCGCGATTMLLNDPDTGVRIDEHNRFVLETPIGARYFLYHCPGCGGCLPDSSKPIWFPKFNEAEQARLIGLAVGLDTAESAIEQLGTPDYDAYMVQFNHPDEINPIVVSEHDVVDMPGWFYNEEESMKVRNIEYYNLSEHADIH